MVDHCYWHPAFFLHVLICHLHSLTLAGCTGTTADTSGDTTIQLGSLLDDGQWHDVEVTRKEQDLSLTVDRLTMTNVTNGDFYQLDLDRKVGDSFCVSYATEWSHSQAFHCVFISCELLGTFFSMAEMKLFKI